MKPNYPSILFYLLIILSSVNCQKASPIVNPHALVYAKLNSVKISKVDFNTNWDSVDSTGPDIFYTLNRDVRNYSYISSGTIVNNADSNNLPITWYPLPNTMDTFSNVHLLHNFGILDTDLDTFNNIGSVDTLFLRKFKFSDYIDNYNDTIITFEDSLGKYKAALFIEFIR